MRIQNARAYVDGRFQEVSVTVKNGKIIRVGGESTPDDGEILDAGGRYLTPGFIDIHIHGANGCDFCDGSEKAFSSIAGYLASAGVTSFLGTSMAYDKETLLRIFETARPVVGRTEKACATMRGIYMEGPFFSPCKKGAQAEKYIINPNLAMFDELNRASGEAVKVVAVAPELPGAAEFIRAVSGRAKISVGHTDADYDTAAAALQNGATQITHLFNAMPPLHHRKPGVIGAASDYAECVEVISDGVHLHPAIVRLAFRLFGRERLCLISDAMRACGLEPGEYELGGQPVFVKDGRATLKDGTLAGACTPLPTCVRRAISFGVPAEDALFSATAVPARRAGVADRVGFIAPGMEADMLLLDDGFSVERVLLHGEWLPR